MRHLVRAAVIVIAGVAASPAHSAECDVVEEVRRTVTENLGIPIDRISPDSDLEELGADEIDIVEIATSLAYRPGFPFRYTFTDHEYRTPQELSDIVCEHWTPR